MVEQPILIVGVSCRAAAASARRSGFSPWVIDLFGDEDTRRLAEVRTCELADYPRSIAGLAERIPPMPFVYTGGIENHPRLVDELSRERERWGNSSEVLERVRDPFKLQAWFKIAGIGFPRTVRELSPDEPGTWLRKPYASGGGRGIDFANGANRSDEQFWQAFREGESMSAIFASDRSTCELLGSSYQLIGQDWLHAEDFAYCGTIGPDAADVQLEGELKRIANLLVEKSGLRGVWGFDFLLWEGEIVVLEVNPRYTASIEILEHQLGVRSFDWIRWAFAGGPKPVERSSSERIFGKAIYFARNELTFPTSGPWLEALENARDVENLGEFADIPLPNSISPTGFPILTFFAEARTRAECLIRLQSRAMELDQLFSEAAP